MRSEKSDEKITPDPVIWHMSHGLRFNKTYM